MKLTINNNEENFDVESLKLLDLISKRDLTFKRLLIRVNGVVIKENDRENVILKDGEVLDIVRIISGG